MEKNYGVSALNSASQTKRNKKPAKVEFRPRQEDIEVFIPVVTLATAENAGQCANDSPRSVGTEHSVLTAGSYQYKIAPGRANASAAKAGRANASLKLPVQILRGHGHGDGGMVVEVSARNSSTSLHGSAKLSWAEQGLPLSMQGYRKRVAADMLHKLRESLSLSASGAKLQKRNLDQDEFSMGSEPEHYSSGASLAMMPKRNSRPVGISSLWAAPDSAENIAHREMILERKRRGEYLEPPTLDAHSTHSKDAYSQGSDDDVSLRLAIQAGEYLARNSGVDYGLQELEQDSMYSLEHSDGGRAEYTASQSILSLGDGAPGLGDTLAHAHAHARDAHHDPIRDRHYEALGESKGNQLQDLLDQVQGDDEPSPELLSALLAAAPAAAMLSVDHVDFNLTSITRQKLQQLGKYVLGHTYRKVLVAWNFVDARFQKSSLMKTEMVRDGSGLYTPQKHAAQPLSTLVAMLCSPQVRVVHSELPGLCKQLDCDAADVLRARRIACIRLILGPDLGKNLKQKNVLHEELKELTEGPPEKLISGLQFKNLVFPADPVERDKLLQTIEEERSLWIRQQVAERKKRDEVTERVETRRVKLIQDYDDTLRAIQFPKGPLAPHRLQVFKVCLSVLVLACRIHRNDKS